MPIAQVLVSAARASPAPIAKATHSTPGDDDADKDAQGDD